MLFIACSVSFIIGGIVGILFGRKNKFGVEKAVSVGKDKLNLK